MNAKKAKALRRAARESTTGLPLVAYKPLPPVRIYGKGDIACIGPSALHLGDVVMKRLCTRSRYQRMKKQFKHMPISVIAAQEPARELALAA